MSDTSATHRFFFTGLIASIAVIAFPIASNGDDPDNCLLCHQYRGLSRFDVKESRLHLFFVDPAYSEHHLGPHSRLSCTDCHDRKEVGTVPHQTVSPVNCARSCHIGEPTGLAREFSHDNIAPMLELSAHAPATLASIKFERGPVLNAGQSQCLYCHDEPVFRDPSIAIPRFKDTAGHVLDRCEVCHSEKVPADIDYYIKHIASRLEPARSSLELAQTCSVCHSDPRVMEDFKLPNSVASYVRSFHGKAALLGDQTTANCISCHIMAGENAHTMLRKDNPRSSVNVAHVADSCRSYACHPGAEVSIADNAVHLDLPASHGGAEFIIASIFIVLTIFTFGPSAMLVLLDLVHTLAGRAEHGESRAHRQLRSILVHPEGRMRLKRIAPRHRVAHWILSVLFTLLVLTGFPLKFPDQAWAAALIHAFGGLAIARVFHHWCGIALVVGFLAHMLDILLVFIHRARSSPGAGLQRWIKAWTAMPMWITPDDLRKTRDLFAHLLFLRRERPTFGRFSPAEKFEYLGVFWGTILLGITGVLLWGEQISSRFLSGRALNIATIAHTYEAFLALIHVGILHIYNVMLAPKVFPLSRATLTGTTPLEKLAEEHGNMIEDVARDLGITDGGADAEVSHG